MWPSWTKAQVRRAYGTSVKIWKIVGLASVVGVAASGAMTVRSERQRRAYTPEEVRSRLHERVAAAHGGPSVPPR